MSEAEVTEVGRQINPSDPDINAAEGTTEDLTHKVHDGKKLPIFFVEKSCVLAEDCVRTDGLFKLDPNGKCNNEGLPRAIVMRQPRTLGEVEIFREIADLCPVKAIKEQEPE